MIASSRPRARSADAGFTLVEMLVTVAIVGITFAVFVGGMGTAILTSDYHRKHANTRAVLRNFAEAIKAAPYDPSCDTARDAYAAAYAPPSPERQAAAATSASTTSHVAPGLTPSRPNSLLLTFFTVATGSTFTTPNGMAELWDAFSTALDPTQRVTASAAEQTLAAAVATGTRTANSALPAAASVAQSMLLEPQNGATTPIVRRGFTTAPATAATSVRVAKPAGTAVGDTLVAHVALRGDTPVTAQAGWSLVNSTASGTAVRSLVYQRSVTTAASETYTWTFGAARDVVAAMVAYSGEASALEASVTGFRRWTGEKPATDATFVACPGTDNEMQRVQVTVRALDGRAEESAWIVKRKP